MFDASQAMAVPACRCAQGKSWSRAAQMQLEHGTAYDMPYGTDDYRKMVFEKYWQLDPSLGFAPGNILGVQGGRMAW